MVVRGVQVVLHIVLDQLEVDRRQRVVVVIVAVAGVDWVELGVSQVRGDVVAGEGGNHEGVDEVLVEEEVVEVKEDENI